MKNELLKTGLWAAAALALVIAAVSVEPDARRAEIFSDQGETLFPGLRDAEAVKAIEVIEYIEADATARPLKAEFRKGRWVLSSHYDYPAEARTSIAATAGALVDLKKDAVVSESFDDHARYGVIDPMDAKVTSLTGRGKRLTLKDQAGAVLADVILGEREKNRPGYRYVRIPGQKRVYSVKTAADPSARFEDWVEGNFLRITPAQVQRIVILNYSLDERMGRLAGMQRAVFTRAGEGWNQEGGNTKLSPARVQALLNALASLRPVGVRPKPKDLAEQLRSDKGLEMTLDVVMGLRQRGFLITPEGRLLASEGEIVVELPEKKSVTVRFGAVASATDDKAGAKGPQENRFVFVSSTDPTLRNRFADWFYVLTGADVERLQPLRGAVAPPAGAPASPVK